jgi:hypothetical protein
MQETLLEQADRHISDCKRRIEEQRKRIFELERVGGDTTGSSNFLATLIYSLALAEQRRDCCGSGELS